MTDEMIENVKRFLKSGDIVLCDEDWTSATMLYFKALFVAFDILLLRTVRKTPQDHGERFRLLEKHFPDDYTLLDRYFLVYRSTYTTTIDKAVALEVRDYAKKTIARHLGI